MFAEFRGGGAGSAPSKYAPVLTKYSSRVLFSIKHNRRSHKHNRLASLYKYFMYNYYKTLVRHITYVGNETDVKAISFQTYVDFLKRLCSRFFKSGIRMA